MSLKKSIILWVVSLIIMLIFHRYQKMTGPTYPYEDTKQIGTTKIDYELPRSTDGDGKDLIKIKAPSDISGKIKFRRFRSYDEWQYADMRRSNEFLYADIPEQPAAGKVMYEIYLKPASGGDVKLSKEPIIIRFKGDVPAYYLFPHIFFMFFAFWFSVRTGFEGLYKGKNTYLFSWITVICFFFGGMVLGPIIQLHAFGALWTGWPFGHDLTDNKTLVAFVMWIVALWRIKKNPNQGWWAVIAAVVLIAVYLIPHSVLGSEIDFTKVPK